MNINPDRVPVIVGAAQVNDRPNDPFAGLDSLGLMAAAARGADGDAGGGWLSALDSVAVVDQLSFPELGDLSSKLAAELGATPQLCYKSRYPSGASPIRMLNEAATRIAAGEIESALIAGGEALRTAAQRKAARGDQGEDAMRAASTRRRPEAALDYGLVTPTDIYPLYENATRAAWGQTLAEAQRESAEMWSRMSEVAARNEHAWLRKAISAEDILTISPDNRPIAFPYSKLMVANSSVNQGAAFIVTSLAAAKRHGISEDRIAYVGYGAAADEPGGVMARDHYSRSASMIVSLTRALEVNGAQTADFDAVELYSCFPCIPKMARRVLNWPSDQPVTVFGGLTFGGGPIGNYMSHAVASMLEALRGGARRGLLFANGGFANQNHTIVLTRDPAGAASTPRSFNFHADADSARDPIPTLAEEYAGSATIETYTVLYRRDGSVRVGVIVARSPAGERVLAHVPPEDMQILAFLTDGTAEPVGASGHVRREGAHAIWRM